MAEAVAFGIAEKIVTDLGFLAGQEIGLASSIKKELEKLKATVSMIKAVLLHAEEIQLDNPAVREWLRRIKDAAYEADDIIDDFVIEAFRQKTMVQDSFIKLVRIFASSPSRIVFHFKMSGRIRNMRGNLYGILYDRKFQLETRVEDKRVQNSGRDQTHSHVVEANIFGREVDKSEILKLLWATNGQDNLSLSVIPIQGMGGLGKTTLAQIVYNAEGVGTDFEHKMWVCVSEEFDVKNIVEKVIRSVTDSECPELDMDQLQKRLREQIDGKRFLLVLDDVWNEDVNKWETLKDLLCGGAMGSKIIVTTRSEKVARIMGTVSTYRLSGLSEDDCWNLFKGRAFKGRREEAHPELVEIGRDIVRKCGGVPLAAQTLGSVMFLKARKQDWESLRNNELWRLPQNENDILPALKISYIHLPFYLRQCFAYCSIFPKDHEIKKEMLIQLWMAQGFIHCSDENRFLEDIGCEYVDDLMWRSFFQEPKVGEDGNLESFKMHDLVHDLAKFVAGVECFTVYEVTKDIPMGVRHLCFTGEPSSLRETLSVVHTAPSVRTLIFTSEITYSINPINNFLSVWKFLRVLILQCSHTELPSSIGVLKHLRYLEIACDNIKSLPKSITNLQSLQTLNLRCMDLKMLPGDTRKMINLRHIDIKGCSLSYMPLGLKELTCLQTLGLFMVGKDGIGCQLNELGGLRDLGGEMMIEDLENVKNASESAKTNLKEKKNLRALKLLWNETDGDDDINSEKVAFDVLENLEPHPNLKTLEVNGYTGTSFPLWLMEPSLSNAVKVTLWGCRKCQELPPFGQLPFLKVLDLMDLEALRFIEGKVTVRREEWFPSLRTLSLWELPNLENWVATENGELCGVAFPSLVELRIIKCPKLNIMPLFPSIEKLDLYNCNAKLVHSSLSHALIPEKLASLSSSSPSSSTSNSSSLFTLKFLTVSDCNDLEFLPENMFEGLVSLKWLAIEFCPRLICLPMVGLHGLTSLLSLKLNDCESLTTLSAGMRYLTSLQSLKIYRCEKLHSLVGMDGLASLQTLELFRLPKLVSLSDEFQSATNLHYLQIRYCRSLVCLPESFRNLTSLQYLQITACPSLQCLPDGIRHLNALQELNIYSCGHLTPRCDKEKGEDWPKIAHVKKIVLNWETIQQLEV